MLPLDVCRCAPAEVAPKCHQCQRWGAQVGQTFGDRTPMAEFNPNNDCPFILVDARFSTVAEAVKSCKWTDVEKATDFSATDKIDWTGYREDGQ